MNSNETQKCCCQILDMTVPAWAAPVSGIFFGVSLSSSLKNRNKKEDNSSTTLQLI